MEQVLMRAEGYTGVVELLEDRVRIKKKGGILDVLVGGADPMGQIRGELDILIKEISAVELKKTTFMAPGYIRFVVKGGQETKARSYKDLKQDEYTVMFRHKKDQSAFDEIRENIEKKRRSLMEEGSAKTSNLDDLEKLAALRDKGIITEEEFEVKKKQLLGL